MKTLNIEQALIYLQNEGIIAYPTETFYAIGGLALSPKACQAVFRAKQRENTQPLPVIIGQIEQLPLIAKNISATEFELADTFWPGPLSILFKAGPLLPSDLLCNSLEVAIRQTLHKGAAEMCSLAGPLSSSSANLSGEPAITDPSKLSLKLIENIVGVLNLPPQPPGGKPSTLVRVVKDNYLQIIRPGAIESDDLKKAGWQIID